MPAGIERNRAFIPINEMNKAGGFVPSNGSVSPAKEGIWNVFGQLTHSRHIKNLMKNKKNQKNGGKDMCKAIDDWVNDAKAEGMALGKTEGMALGKTKGIALGRAEAIIELLEEYGEVPDALKKQLFGQNDIHILKKWLKLSARANSTEEFVRWMHMS